MKCILVLFALTAIALALPQQPNPPVTPIAVPASRFITYTHGPITLPASRIGTYPHEPVTVTEPAPDSQEPDTQEPDTQEPDSQEPENSNAENHWLENLLAAVNEIINNIVNEIAQLLGKGQITDGNSEPVVDEGSGDDGVESA